MLKSLKRLLNFINQVYINQSWIFIIIVIRIFMQIGKESLKLTFEKIVVYFKNSLQVKQNSIKILTLYRPETSVYYKNIC